MVIIPIKSILWLSTVCLHRVTYVYIPYRFKPPYNVNKSIFVYLHGIFTSLYMFVLTHIHNKQ
nr:MAG TPA: hypothetical protein [Caudoviricetes sp.]